MNFDPPSYFSAGTGLPAVDQSWGVFLSNF